MEKTTIALLIFIFAFAFFAGFVLSKNYQEKLFEEELPIISTVYKCDDNKFIIADYFDGKITLNLSDNRSIILPQTEAESGARFADKNEVFVFWNKGNSAFINELGEQTFSNCVINEPAGY